MNIDETSKKSTNVVPPAVPTENDKHEAQTRLKEEQQQKQTQKDTSEKTDVLNESHPNHPFFHYYGMLVHQQNMLQDSIRTGTYQQAIVSNPSNFKDAVVLDVGTGSGILAYFAVQAGAKHVYAVEASDIADRAKTLMDANGLSDKITVIKGTVETVELPEKVDVIISEPMGFLLVHEQMLQSYMEARKRFLKPGGLCMPTIGTIHVVPITDYPLWKEQDDKAAFWNETNFYGLNLTCLRDVAAEDHFSQPVVGTFSPSTIISNDVAKHEINFNQDDADSLDRIVIPLKFTITQTAIVHGLGAWFDVLFDGKDAKVRLDTGPHSAATHWYQCRLLMHKPLAVNAGQTISGNLIFTAHKKYSYNVQVDLKLDGTQIQTSARLNLQDQQYYYLNQTADYSGWYGQTTTGA